MVSKSPPSERKISPLEAQQRRELQRTKIVATALLVLAAIIFILARAYEEDIAWLRFVRVTAEAAMVGAIADWFAVTALFKRPLGLPIPHTALVPVRKDEIGAGLGEFVQSNFLTEEIISEKLESLDVTRSIGLWLREPENARKVVDEMEVPASAVSEVLMDDVRKIMDVLVRERLDKTAVAPIMARVVGAAIAFLEDDGDQSSAVGADIDVRSSQFAERLRSDEGLQAQGEMLKQELLTHPDFEVWTKDLWASLRQEFGDAINKADSVVRQRVEASIVVAANHLVSDRELQVRMDAWIESVAISMASVAGAEIGELIEDTVAEWDADDLIERIEPPFGADLQFIRINGTLVGGLAGLAIFVASEWIF